MSEMWLPILGYEGLYEVSDHGRVRSLDRAITNPLPSGTIRTQLIRGRVLTPGIAKDGGYPYVNLSRGNKNLRSRHIHRIVMDTFIGPRPKGMQTRHLNGDPTDNRLVNLAYGTPTENAADKRIHGTSGLTDRCKRNHERSTENVILRKDGTRDCKPCARIRYAARRMADA